MLILHYVDKVLPIIFWSIYFTLLYLLIHMQLLEHTLKNHLHLNKKYTNICVFLPVQSSLVLYFLYVYKIIVLLFVFEMSMTSIFSELKHDFSGPAEDQCWMRNL